MEGRSLVRIWLIVLIVRTKESKSNNLIGLAALLINKFDHNIGAYWTRKLIDLIINGWLRLLPEEYYILDNFIKILTTIDVQLKTKKN